MVLRKQIDYVRATDEFIPEIVQMHKSYIAGEDLKKFQDLYLGHYYRRIINSDNLVLIALVENRVIGFCSLVKDHRTVVLELLHHNYSDFLKIPLENWFQVLRYITRNLQFEVFGGKWSSRELSKYRSYVELRAIAVNAEYQKLQVGTNLLQTCIDMARKASQIPIIAWVSVDNEASIRLFLKNGFRKVAVRKGELEDRFLFLLNC